MEPRTSRRGWRCTSESTSKATSDSCQTHAIETNEQLKVAEFDHLQQTLDILKAVHDEVRNLPLFIPEAETGDKTVRDPNAFFVDKVTVGKRSLGTSVFQVDDGYHTKTIAKRVK